MGDPVSHGNFRLRSNALNVVFEASFDNAAPLPTDDSYGGWQIIQIPKRMGNTEWQGSNPMGIIIDFYIDRLNSDTDRSPGEALRRERYQLERLAGIGDEDDEPPVVIFNSGGLCPHDWTVRPNWRWVIEGLTWDRDRTVNNSFNNPIFIAGTMTIRRYHEDDVLGGYSGPAKKNRKRKKAKDKKNPDKAKESKTYTVKEGDTLSKIAAKKLGNAARWKEIAKKNNIRNPRNLKVGQVLKMP